MRKKRTREGQRKGGKGRDKKKNPGAPGWLSLWNRRLTISGL